MQSTLSPLVFGMLVVFCSATAVQAQDMIVTGRVTTIDDGLSLPGATVAIPALNLSTKTDQDGRYELIIPAGRLAGGDTVELLVTFAGLPPRTARIKLAPGPVTEDFAIGLAFREEVTVGSRVAGAAAERAVPVDVVTAEQIATTGASETNQIIQALAPSFNFPRPTITDGTDSVRRRHCADWDPIRCWCSSWQTPAHWRPGPCERQAPHPRRHRRIDDVRFDERQVAQRINLWPVRVLERAAEKPPCDPVRRLRPPNA